MQTHLHQIYETIAKNNDCTIEVARKAFQIELDSLQQIHDQLELKPINLEVACLMLNISTDYSEFLKSLLS